jgi:hypothetical protein
VRDRPILGAKKDLDVLLVKAFQSYRQGLLRQSRPPPVLPLRDFGALRFLGTVGWLPLAERSLLRKLETCCSEGLAAARQRRLDDASADYEQAQEYLDRLEKGTRLAWLLGASTCQAGVAYLDFLRSKVERARERLDRSMDADLALEQAGLPVMQLHRLQQGHNLVRMEFKSGRRETAIRHAGVLLAYMEGQTDGLPYHRGWRSRSLQALPRRLMQTMIQESLGETASYIATEGTAAEWRVLIAASRLCRDPESAVFPQAQYALRAQHHHLRNDPDGYLGNLEHFFRAGIRNCPLLWYVLMVELVGFCLEADTHHSRQIRDAILRDSAKLKGMPSCLRAALNGPEAQRDIA